MIRAAFTPLHRRKTHFERSVQIHIPLTSLAITAIDAAPVWAANLSTGNGFARQFTMLIVDPRTNATDMVPIQPAGGHGPHERYSDIAFAPTTNKFYCAPGNAYSVLVFDPMSNESGHIRTDNLMGVTTYRLWDGLVFSPETNKLCE